MHRNLLYAAYGFLLLSGILHFSIDVVSQYMRGKRTPGSEATLYYGLNTAYALGQIFFAWLALLAIRNAAGFMDQWSGLTLGLFAAAGWLTIAFLFLEYREPRIIMAIFVILLVGAAVTATAKTASNQGNTTSDAAKDYALSTVKSKDGTTIGYREYGHGPGVVLVMGAMGTAHNYDQLARTLSGKFTVYVPDRRGRGISPCDYSAEHSIQKDVEDLDVLLDSTGAHYVFGLSSGAVITLEAARQLPSIRKSALYEPPFYLQGMPLDEVARFRQEVEEGKLAAALVTLGKIVGLGPAVFNFVPRPFLELATRMALRRDENAGRGNYAPLRELIRAARFDVNVVAEMDGKLESFRGVNPDILLLGGTQSPRYLKDALDALKAILANARRVELEGLDHSGPWNSDRGGNPELVAEALRGFFRD